MDDAERDKKVLQRFSPHILLMVKAAKRALDEGRARIDHGFLIVDPSEADNVDAHLTDHRKEM